MNSSRFPGKPLARLKGRELLLRVCDNAAKSIADHVVVASEDKLLVDFAIQNGYDAVLTHEHPTCTHRVCEVSKTLRSDYIVNLQGDEPCITPSMINAVINEAVGKQYKMVQATYPIESNDLYDEDCVKAVINNGKIINLTRNPELYTENLRGIAGIYVYDIETIRNLIDSVESITDSEIDVKYEELNSLLSPKHFICLLYTSPSPRDVEESRMPSSA